MDHRPKFVLRTGSTNIRLHATPEALAVVKLQAGGSHTCKAPAAVLSEAQAAVRAAGGDPSCRVQILSQMEVQFEQYHGKTFQWLLTNDVGYAAWLLANHQKERVSSSPLSDNIDALLEYAAFFPPMMAAITDAEGDCLVGCGPHKCLTLTQLHEGQSKELKRSSPEPPPAKKQHLQDNVLPGSLGAGNRLDDLDDLDHCDDDWTMTEVADSLEERAGDSGDAPQTPAQAALLPCPTSSTEIALPKSWKQSLPQAQQAWVSEALFTRDKTGRVVLKEDLRIMYYPPGPHVAYSQPPSSPDAFFQRPFVLWAPYRFWQCHLKCPVCCHKLTACGLYKTVRRVLDRDGWYYMGTEYLECLLCRKKVAAWSDCILSQLCPVHRVQFPAVLTYRLACDLKVIEGMKWRTPGNSATSLLFILENQHERDWINRARHYHIICKEWGVPAFWPSMPPLPCYQWILSVFDKYTVSEQSEMRARELADMGLTAPSSDDGSPLPCSDPLQAESPP